MGGDENKNNVNPSIGNTGPGSDFDYEKDNRIPPQVNSAHPSPIGEQDLVPLQQPQAVVLAYCMSPQLKGLLSSDDEDEGSFGKNLIRSFTIHRQA